MDKLAININTSKDPSGDILQQIIDEIKKNDDSIEIEVYKDAIGLNEDNLKDVDVLLVLGGDGTILRTSRNLKSISIPILGINIGHLGFLTNVEINEFSSVIKEILMGKFHIENRIMLDCTIKDGEEKKYVALNDVVITKGTLSRIVEYSIYINDEYYTSFISDGIIISTPTGSTAYNLSAGGPILHPNLDVVAITPICPHSLAMRTLVLDAKSKIKVIPHSNKEVIYLTLDGQEAIKLYENEEIVVNISDKVCKLVKLNNYNYFDILRNKIIMRRTFHEGES